jgi:integrase
MSKIARPKLPENFYWKDGKICFSIRYGGRRIQRSSGAELIEEAKKARNKMIAKLERGELSGGDPDRVRVNVLLDDYLKSLAHPKRNNTSDYHYIVTKQVDAHVRPFFGEMKAVKVRPPVLLDYRRQRLDEGASQNTVNHELGYLRSAYYFASACEKFPRNAIPDFVKCGAIDRSAIKRGARKGIITEEQLEKLLSELPRYLRPLLMFCWWTGVRKKEARYIRWSQVDFENRTVTLRTGETKSGAEEIVPMFQIVHDTLQKHKRYRDDTCPEVPWVFFNHFREQIKDFRSAWQGACLRAGLAEKVLDAATGKSKVVYRVRFHDTRRSAATALHVQYGMDIGEVKAVTRHQTDEIAIQYIQDQGKRERVRQTVDAAVAGMRTGTEAGNRIVADLLQLQALRLQGALTDEEYELVKAGVLGSVTAGGYDSGYEKQNAPGAGSAMSANY